MKRMIALDMVFMAVGALPGPSLLGEGGVLSAAFLASSMGDEFP